MALIRCEFFSEVLELSTSMTVILPQETTAQIGMSGTARADGHPTLYLLHGLSDDDSIWLRRTSIERYAAPLGLAVVMPQVHRSFYTDEAHGNRYWTFLSEELPQLAHGFFRLSTRREDTFVAGLSMGGYGALKWALNQPERFAAAASLSGALDVEHLYHHGGRSAELGDRVYGNRSPAGTPNDLRHLVRDADPASTPPLYVSCGTADELLEQNRRFVADAENAGHRPTVDFGPGDHEWGYWDERIRDVLDWLPLDHPAANHR